MCYKINCVDNLITAAGVVVAVLAVIVQCILSICLQNRQQNTNRRNELLDKIVTEHQSMIALLRAIKNFRAAQIANNEVTPTETLNSQWIEFEKLCGDFFSGLSRFNISSLLLKGHVDVATFKHLEKLSELGHMVEDLLNAVKSAEWPQFASDIEYRTELTKRIDDYIVQPREKEFQLFMERVAKLLATKG